jgi:sulfoxide reductase heme-binding subunit YedZ
VTAGPGPAAVAAWPDPKALWYLDRAAGLVLLVLLTVAVALGQASVRYGGRPGRDRRLPRFLAVDLHRNAALLGLSLLAVHVGTAVADDFVDITVVDAVLPFGSPYRPVWLSAGTLALDLLVAVAVTTALRRRLGPAGWRVVHRSGLAAWALAVGHGLGTGSDIRRPWVLALVFGCVAVVGAATVLRLQSAPGLSRGLRAAACLLVLTAPLVTAGWLRAGPLQADWGHPAGTPAPAGGHR